MDMNEDHPLLAMLNKYNKMRVEHLLELIAEFFRSDTKVSYIAVAIFVVILVIAIIIVKFK